jgi:hypothetical protein
MFVDQRLREAELDFLNAPFEAEGWRHAIERMAEVTRSAVGQLCGFASGLSLPYNLLSADLHDPHGHLHNPDLYGPDNWRVAVTRGVMTVQHDVHYADYRACNRPSFYDDACSDLDVPYGCQTALARSGSNILGLALLRSRKDGPCSGDVLTNFARLAYQAQRAMRVQIALGQQSAELMLTGIRAQLEATILLDRFGNLAAHSEAAEPLFDTPHGLRLNGLRVMPAVKAEADAFDSAMARLLASDGLIGPIVHDFRFGRSAARPAGRWRGLLVRLPRSQCELGFAPELALTVTEPS